MSLRSRIPPQVLLLIPLLLVGLSSCENDDVPLRPELQVGVLQGYVLVGGEGMAMELDIDLIHEDNMNHRIRTARSDSTGWYSVELPAGRYALGVYAGLSGSCCGIARDTIRVGPAVQRYDVVRARTIVRIRLPEGFDGASSKLHLERRAVEWWRPCRVRLDSDVEADSLVFDLMGLVPGEWAPRLDVEGVGTDFYLPGSIDPDSADIFIVDALTTTVNEYDLRSGHRSISGTVTGAWMEADALSPSIVSWNANRSFRRGHACDAETGAFRIHQFAAAPLNLSVGFSWSELWIGGDDLESAQVFDLEPGEHVTGVDVVDSGFRVTLEGPGNQTLYKGWFWIYREDGTLVHDQMVGNNPLLICNLRAEGYKVMLGGGCQGERWSRRWLGGAEDFANAQTFTLAEGELRDVVLNLTEGGSIRLPIVFPEDDSIYDWDVEIHNADGEERCDHAPWGTVWLESGSARWRGLNDGTYYLSARRGNGERRWYPDAGEFEAAQPLEILEAGALELEPWVLSEPEAEVQR